MTLTDYTSYDEVRAVLGVSDDELEDATLALDLYLAGLQMELDDIDATLQTQYATVKALVDNNGSPSEAQRRFYDGVRLFAAYAVGNALTPALPLFSPKDVADGKTTTGRFADSPYREVIKNVRTQYERLRLRLPDLLAKLADNTSTATPRVYFSVAPPSSDPVTGT